VQYDFLTKSICQEWACAMSIVSVGSPDEWIEITNLETLFSSRSLVIHRPSVTLRVMWQTWIPYTDFDLHISAYSSTSDGDTRRFLYKHDPSKLSILH
jgi:hypothetical protein